MQESAQNDASRLTDAGDHARTIARASLTLARVMQAFQLAVPVLIFLLSVSLATHVGEAVQREVNARSAASAVNERLAAISSRVEHTAAAYWRQRAAGKTDMGTAASAGLNAAARDLAALAARPDSPAETASLATELVEKAAADDASDRAIARLDTALPATLARWRAVNDAAVGLADRRIRALRGWLVARIAGLVAFAITANAALAFVIGRSRSRMYVALDGDAMRLMALVEHSPDMLAIVDPNRRIAYASPSTERILGFRPKALVGKRLVDLLVDGDPTSRLDQMFAAAAGRDARGAQAEWRMRHRDGSIVDVELSIAEGSKASVLGGAAIGIHDITERKQLEQDFARRAVHDELTSLANRTLFQDRLEHALARHARSGESLAVLFLDLDDFKTVNDSLGHGAGDALLVEIANRLRGALRKTDTPARLGGDEFAVLAESLKRPGDVVEVARRMLGAFDVPVVVEDTEVLVRPSIGIAVVASDIAAADASSLMRDADIAMYAAKAAGGGQFRIFEPEMHAAASRRLELKADLRVAQERGQLAVHYQPIVELGSERVVGVEALLRWTHPRYGGVSPVEFIPLAEETGAIGDIGAWVLERACAQASYWQRRQAPGEKPLTVSVNLSSKQLDDAAIVQRVAAILQQTGVARGSLVLEITESALIREGTLGVDRLAELRALGIRLAVDDFGTGYSSLAYLGRLPLDIVKIDRVFVNELQAGGERTELAAAIVSLGETLGLSTVAEGVEQATQAEELAQLGCAFAQGYLFSRPITGEEMTTFLGEPAARAA